MSKKSPQAANLASRNSSSPKKSIRSVSETLPALSPAIEQLWDVLPGSLWKLNGEGLILDANQSALDFLGYSKSQFLGRSVDEFFWDGMDFQKLVAALFYSGKAHGILACLRCQDGSTREVTLDASSLDGGQIVYCAINDRSVQRRTEDHALAQAASLEKPAEVIFIQTLDGIVTHWSLEAEKFYGFKATEILGKKIPSQIALPAEFAKAALQAVLANGEWSGQGRILSGDARPIDVQTRWVLLNPPDGQPPSILILAEDAAELLQLNEDRLRAHRHECVGMLSGGIAHDLNNVLQPISMFLDLLRYRLPDAESVEMLDAVEANLRRSTDLVRQILAFSSGARTEQHTLNIPELISEVSTFIRSTFPKTIQFQVIVPEKIHPVLGNATQLEQVLLNLCVNARDAMPDGGRIKIEVSNFKGDESFVRRHSQAQAQNYVRITVSDTGHGIPRPLRKKIFEPFFTTKGPNKGTGLGLATAVGIIRNHGGFLTLETEEGCGSSFHAFLPASTGPLEPISLPPSIPENQKANGHGEAILLVDDESIVLKVMARSLEKAGYRVLAADDGDQGCALYKLHQKDIRLVITDMAMPGMDGPALISALKKINPRVKIICTSGFGSSSGKNSPAELGVHAILSKPCNSRVVIQAIQEALSANPPTT